MRPVKYLYYALVSNADGLLVGRAHGGMWLTVSPNEACHTEVAWQMLQDAVRREFIERNRLIARDIRVWLLHCVALTPR